jgi:hypothetical protein
MRFKQVSPGEKGTGALRIKWISAFAAVTAAAVTLFQVAASGQGGYKSFQLIYHSDTRGYYRPCG